MPWERHHPLDRRHAGQRQGSVFLAGMMTVSFVLLVSLGLVTQALSERASTELAIRSAKAAQLAHAGVELALWEINYGGARYLDGIVNTNKGTWSGTSGDYTFTGTDDIVDSTRSSLSGLIIHVTDSGGGDILIKSVGEEIQVNRQINLTVIREGGGSGKLNLFEHALYSQGGDYQDGTNIYLGGYTSIDSYDSNTGNHTSDVAGGALNACTGNCVIIRTDAKPGHDVSWDPPLDITKAAAIVIDDGPGKILGELMFRSLDTAMGENYNFPSSSAEPGYLFYGDGDGDSEPDGPVANLPLRGITEIKDGATRSPIPVGYMALFEWPEPGDSGYYADVPMGETTRWCKNDDPPHRYDEIIVKGKNTRLIIGCAAGECGSCSSSGNSPSDTVVITTGSQASGVYPLDIGEAGKGQSKGLGQIIIRSPTEIYFQTPNGHGILVGGLGIVNDVIKASGAIDPSALRIFGGEGAAATSDSIFSTNTPFHGVFFNPMSKVSFTNSGTLEFYGALNARQINTGTAAVNIHYDEALMTNPDFENWIDDPNGGEGGDCDSMNPCTPDYQTWSFQ